MCSINIINVSSMRKLLSIIAMLVLSLTMLMAQNTKTVTGSVISEEDGEAIIGATVIVPGTNIGTVTDIDGNFSLKVPTDTKTLNVSYVGLESQQVTIGRSNKVRVVLSANNEVLDEVMVVAFGTQKKSAFTGSAAVIDSKQISDHITTNVSNALAGTVPGLQIRGTSGAPGSSQGKINIRGIASLYAETDPLVIVDGAPYDGNLSNIPQQDIENITVLKDASSAALYGARGAAGVILITTKRGKTQDARITVDMRWGANTRAIQEYDKITDPAQFYEVYYSQRNNYYLNNCYNEINASIAANRLMLSHLGYNIYTVPEGEFLIGTNGKLNPNATYGRSYVAPNGETYYLQGDDWADAAYNTGMRQEYNVSATAGNDRSSFYLSSGFLEEDGVVEYSGYKRFNTRFKGDYQAKKWLKLGANMSYVNSRTTSNPNLTTDSYGSTNMTYYTSMIAPIYPIYVRTIQNGVPAIRTDENGNPQYDYGVSSTNYPGLSRAFLQTGNPLGSNRYNSVISRTNNFFGTITADVDFTSFLRFNSTNSINWYDSKSHDYENALYGPKVGVNGQIDKSNTEIIRQNYIQTLNYYDTFAEKHNVDVKLGHEWSDSKTTYLFAAAQGLFSPDIQEINAAANQQYQSKSYTREYNIEGWFGSANYNFDEKYFISGSYRRDASSRFAKENRWGNFWSVGGAWMISKEAFMDTQSWVDMLKFKVSIGQLGNDNIGNWAYIDLYSLSPASTTQMSPSFSRIGNKDITWETTTNFNTGFDFSFWKGRLSGTVEYYYKKTTDLLFWLSVPESAGSRGYYGNIGDISNKGFEVVLNGDIVRYNGFTWNVGLNMAFNTTKIIKLPESKIADNGGFYESSIWYAEGEGLYNFMTYAYAGVNENGQALYYYDADLSPLDENGVVNPDAANNISKAAVNKTGTTTEIGYASRYANGSIMPKVTGGFNTTLSAYGVDVQLAFDYQLGGKIYDSGYRTLMMPTTGSANGYTFHKDILDSWSKDNTGSDLPRFMYGDTNAGYGSDRFLTDASYLNFQSFTVGYTFPKKWLTSLGLNQLRIYCSGENLYFWSKRKGLDPRYDYKENTSIAAYAPVRTVMGGIQVTF